ncbi:MAG TPA: hypothetical protein VMN36_10020, partial [Verrucomicrobiales bacterium]|nr:hypothetical protein [Verrucomicrobiales bacterium]
MPSRFRITYLILLPLLGGTLAWLAAANGSSNLRIDPAGAVTFSVEETGPSVLHRIEVSSGLRSWTALRTVASAGGNLQYSEPVDAAPEGRYYRAAPENDPRAIPGDHLATSDGDVVIHPVQHASFVLRWRDLILYNDPVGGAAPYAGLPPAGLILVGHQHGDHFNT